MNTKEIISELQITAGKNGLSLTKSECKIILQSFTETLENLILNHSEKIILKNFGRFIREIRPARITVNPQTREKIEIPERTVIRFKASETLKSKLNG